jgi:autotransporter-associated beta strand protein
MKNTPVCHSSFGVRFRVSSVALAAAFASLSLSAQTNVSTLSPTAGLLSLTGGTNSTNYNLNGNFTVNVATADATMSGILSGTVGTLTKTGTTNLLLTNTASSFTGAVKISAGGIYASSLGNTGGNSSLGQNSTISIGNSSTAATLRLTGTTNETSNKVVNLSGTTGGATITVTGATYTFSSNTTVTGTGAKTLVLATSGGNGGQGITLNGVIADGTGSVISVRGNGSGNGVFRLGNTTNSFSGGVTLDGNTNGRTYTLEAVKIGNTGQTSSLGSNGTIKLGSSVSGSNNVLSYVGAGENTDKVINLAGTVGNVRIDQAGSGLIKFTSDLSVTGVGAKTFGLNGSSLTGTGEFAGKIVDSSSGATTLAKGGSGTWTVSGNNSYTGGTSVNAGKLLVNNTAGSGTGTGSVTVAASALLGGNGTISGVTTIGAGAFLSPGNSPGVLTFADNLILASTSTTTMEISGTDRGTSYDGITMSGSSAKSLTFGGTLNLIFGTAVSDTVTAGVYDLFALGNVGQSGAFSSVSISGTALNVVTPTAATGLVFAGSNWTASMTDAAAAIWNLSFDSATGDLTIAAIPEPSSLAVGFGAAAFGYIALYRRRKAR